MYTRAELEAISQTAHRHGLLLYVDGARLAYGLAASDLTLPDLARLCDVFYLGGTKAGALFGEAVVILNEALKRDFRYLIKQRGGCWPRAGCWGSSSRPCCPMGSMSASDKRR